MVLTLFALAWSTDYCISIFFLPAWFCVLLFAFVFFTFGAFSVSLPFNVFLLPSSRSPNAIELFRVITCVRYTVLV